MAPTLGYWSGRALAEPSRLLLHYAGVDFEDKRYNLGPNFDRSEWLNEKFSLGLELPNLPYYIDGDIKITQSKAILRYLARKHGLAGNNETEHWKLDMLEQELHDLAQFVSAKAILFDGKTIEEYREEYGKTAPEKIKKFCEYLGDKKWLLGDRLTYVDFMAYDVLYYHKVLLPKILDPHPNLQSYIARFEGLKGVKEYIASPACHLPFWAVYKKFLTNEQNLCRLATCEDMLEITRTVPEWKDKIITGDETWVHGYDPETKRQSAEWRGQAAHLHFTMAPTLGYWGVRALAEPIRLLLHHVGVDFEDKRYKMGPNFDKSEWLKEKFSLGLEFPNLPYYIDGDVKITQSKAILRYLARKHGLAGKNETENWKLDMLEQQMTDLAQPVSPRAILFGGKTLEEYREEYGKTAPENVKKVSVYLGDKKWLLGDRLTYVDFMAYDVLYYHKVLLPKILDPPSQPSVL
ncbi:GSTM2, partial [Cordylochernes scorpioides]